jgi:hypothetical protein
LETRMSTATDAAHAEGDAYREQKRRKPDEEHS